MRLHQYLNEDTWSYDDMVSLIKSNCNPFLKDWQSTYKYNFLYSGRKSSKDFDIKTIRKNRKPQNTSLDIHNIVDDWFYREFGVRARSNAMFGTFNRSMAEIYGNLFIVFPIGKYVMLSSDKVRDLYLKLGTELVDYTIWADFKVNEEVKATIINFLEKSNYKKNIYNLNEQMVICKKYYMIHGNYNHILKGDLLR